MVEILCTLIGVMSGIAVVAALMHQQGARKNGEANSQAHLPQEAEELQGLTSQLQMLTQRVAADVSAHTQKVVHINERLLPAQNEPERILTAITDLIQANESMQGQLEAAQVRLSKQTEQLESTARQARTDALTGLANRRALEESLKKCVDTIDQTQATGLMLIDIDHFKSFNDSYGHITGDAVLASFAKSISAWCSGKYYAARYGGEEFAVILSGDSSATLANLAADLRTYISAQIIEHEDLRLTITASAGLTLIQNGDTLNRVYERADEGLYRSKKAGRNRGHWLDKGEWKLLFGDSGSEQESTRTFSNETAKANTQNCIDVNKSPIANASQTTETTQSDVDDSGVLDLAAFVERLDTQLKQLGRAEMPAAAIMVDAIGLAPQLVRNFDRSWASVLEIVQVGLRGIDSVCRLRKNTLCIFMPGYNMNAALERAGGMQHMLEERRAGSEGYPERFAISAGCAQVNESAGIFLQRLEDALDEAQDAAMFEVVACESTSSYFHAT